MSRNFNHDIKERSTAGTLSNITFFTLKNPESILKIETIISSKTIRQRATPKQKSLKRKLYNQKMNHGEIGQNMIQTN